MVEIDLRLTTTFDREAPVMTTSRRPLRGGTGPLIVNMRRHREQVAEAEAAANEPLTSQDEDNSRLPLLVGELVTAYLDNGISITLTNTGEGDEPYRVVVLRMGRQVGPPAQRFAAEAVARVYARERTVEHYEGGAITSEVRRQSGRVYRRVGYPKR
jgi:hypothetical protein